MGFGAGGWGVLEDGACWRTGRMTLDSCQCGVWGMLFGVCSVCVLRWSTRMTARSPHPVRPCRCPCGEQKDDTDICNEYFVGVGYMLVAVLVVAFLLGVFVAYLAVKGGCKVCARHHTSKGGRGATPLPSFGAGAVGHARRCGVGDGGGGRGKRSRFHGWLWPCTLRGTGRPAA